MSRRLKFWMFPALLAGLLWGGSLPAQGYVQSDAVTYALTLIDAGEDGTNDTRTGTTITESTTKVRVKVTVSIPRSVSSTTYGGVPVIASPVRLMFRKHKGPATAFDGSIALVRDAPYSASDTPLKTAFYPMPQTSTTDPSGIESDPTKLNLYAVVSGQTTNVKGEMISGASGYIAKGWEHNPARWESTFLSVASYDIGDLTTLESTNPMIASLLTGKATYEWYAASRYGLGSFARISDIQDLGRYQTFADVRLWQGSASADDATVDTSSKQQSLGGYFDNVLRAMPGVHGDAWHIYRGSVGRNGAGDVGLQFLNVVGSQSDYSDYARLESPRYPDGISAISFEALTSATGDWAQELLVQWRQGGGTTWTDVATVEVSATTFTSYTVDFDGVANGDSEFRIVRATRLDTTAENAESVTLVIRNLAVRSASPVATFGRAVFSPKHPAYEAYADDGTAQDATATVSFAATGGTGVTVPRGYDVTLKLRRRADLDLTRSWYSAPLTVESFNADTGAATLQTTLAQETLITATDGSVNVEENAFFLDAATGNVSGVLPGVYDMALSYRVLGSFKAGRTLIDERETVEGEATTYAVTSTDDEGESVTVQEPYLLDYREQQTQQARVFLRVTYRSGEEGAYTLESVDVPLLPTASKPSEGLTTWRADVLKELRLEDDDTAVYAWGDDSGTITTGVLSCKVGAVTTDNAGNETVTWFGQNATAISGTMPPQVSAIPAVSETLVQATGEDAATPLVITLDDLTNSHVMFELAMPQDVTAAGAQIVAKLCGSFWQDFNTWYAPSDGFTKADFKEDVDSRTADFDCEVATDGSAVTAGWIPDEGPLAQTTSFTDTFEVGRGSDTTLPFWMPDFTNIAGTNFASWGAGSTEATYTYLRSTDSSYASSRNTRYMRMSSGVEVVLNRASTRASTGRYTPDAQIRLRGQSRSLTPRSDSKREVALNGVGTVSFRLGLSLPYNIGHRVEFRSAEDDATPLRGYGVAAGVQFDSASSTCATSGYSVSYYLRDSTTIGLSMFELRLTQLLDFKSSETDTPGETVIAELYRWTAEGATRLALEGTPSTYRNLGGVLNGRAFALWVTNEGKLAVGTASSATPSTYTRQFLSSTSVASTTTPYILGVGSAECRPRFRQVLRATSAVTTPFANGTTYVAISPTEVQLYQPTIPSWAGSGTSWTLSADPSSSTRIQVSRRTPPADEAGRVVMRIISEGGDVLREVYRSTNTTGTTVSATLGATNVTLEIAPADENCNVFIDNLFLSSWCGNDNNRNGSYVPLYTDVGFFSSNGFAGVGVWIRPEEDEQLDVAAKDYTGKQCVLLQRSRANTAQGTEGATDGITNTRDTLALYMPYTETGFGTVSFRYRIPSEQDTPVRVMLQYQQASRIYNNYLGTAKPDSSGWVDVSGAVELSNTAGAWVTASITPKLDGAELVGVSGLLRLVLVTEGLETTDDPYVYIDDLRVTDNGSSTLASWSATNVKFTTDPVSELFWKDRAAADSSEEHFAEKSRLTQALQFNDVTGNTQDSEADGNYVESVLASPHLENGAGRLTFSARLVEPRRSPMRLYILASEEEVDSADLANYKALTYVEVENTVYKTYDIDLSKFSYYYTKLNADMTPGESGSTDAFACANVRRLQLRAYLEGDSVDDDGFTSSTGESRTPPHARVLVDRVAVINPLSPSLRVEKVAFSNVAGIDVASDFDRNSPLSQPVAGSPLLRTMVELGHAQLLKQDSIRVFVTLDMQNSASATSKVKRYTSDYEYTNVLGQTYSATTARPIYAWDKTAVNDWPLSAWFDLSGNLENLRTTLSTGSGSTLTTEELATLGIANTVELKRAEGSAELRYFGDLKGLGVTELPANSLVRYSAWAVFQEEDSEQWYATQISPTDYTDFPWYFPRGLNAELQAKASQGADFFSPYFWVYSCLPGEVFINEFDLRDQGGVQAKVAPFVELCAPAALDIGGWQVCATESNTFEFADGYRFIIADGTTLLQPDAGAVPAKREADSTAERAFYTALSASDNLFATIGGVQTSDLPASTRNGGAISRGLEYGNLGSNNAASLFLLRPTGGAEHIVVFSTAAEGTITAAESDAYQQGIDTLYDAYRAAYVNNGFASEWYQTFLDGGWGDDTTFGAMALNESGLTLAQAHARRLTKANFYPALADSDKRFNQTAGTFEPVQDYASSSYANSMATVDMGGIWVTRKNATNTTEANGPMDLTALCDDSLSWPAGVNPTVTPRQNEPIPTDAPEGATQPYTQVTPRQINPDQYLLKYRALSRSSVSSTLEGNLLGTHLLEILDDAGTEATETYRAGRSTPKTWALSMSNRKVALKYSALPFQQITSVTLRLMDVKTGEAETDRDKIVAQLIGGETLASDPDAQGWVTLTVPDASKAFTIKLSLLKPGSSTDEDRYNVEAKATFAFNENSSYKDVITHVSPYCGGTADDSSRYQPWWGSGFGFSVTYDETQADEAQLTSFIVTYPSPAGLSAEGTQWRGFQAPWAGLTLTYTPDDATESTTVSLLGMEYSEAIAQIQSVFGPKGNMRYAELKAPSGGSVASTSLVGILSDTYASAMGYSESDASTFAKKEPAIPFCVWGVYTATVQSDSGNSTVSFLLPQASPGEKAGVFTVPSWYQPLSDLNAGKPSENTAPYFYLYSTPPQSAWLNELNLAGGTSSPYAEVVMPIPRDGILNATPNVPDTTNHGWSVRAYSSDTGAQDGEVSLAGVTRVASNSSSYSYNSVDLPTTVAKTDRRAYVLIRPCGAAEGGVWSQVTAEGGADVSVPTSLTQNSWLAEPETYYVVAGKSDASGSAGSVQLIGKRYYDASGLPRVSSKVADRTEWVFSTTESRDTANEGFSPDTNPEWNQVSVSSLLRNTVYGGVLCGYQYNPGYFTTSATSGVASTQGTLTTTLSGIDWKFDASTGKTQVLSFRPRANYRFESLELPPELVGHVMLIGQDQTLTEAEVTAEVARLRALATTNPDAPTQDWIRMGSADRNGVFRAVVETTTYTDASGTTQTAPSGTITFNPDYIASDPAATEVFTFGDQDEFVITLVFVDEPPSAQNTIRVNLGQGDVQTGAWLSTQSFYALADDGTPDTAKGGGTTSKPIWTDEDGDVDGEHKDVHGWVYQPVIGDKLGMTVVINPELGLVGGKNPLGSSVELVRSAFAENNYLRPFLVWTLIPKSKVPTNLFDSSSTTGSSTTRSTFMQNWKLGKWLGSEPSIADQITMPLATLRRTLKSSVESTAGFPSAAGIVPLTYRGYCAADRSMGNESDTTPPERATDTLLAFSAMTEDELTAAIAAGKLSNDDTTLLPFTSSIDMTDTSIWAEGAVLRFAVVIADTSTVYDCQSLANFSSDNFAGYCPWYVPEEDTNINRVTSSENYGISPYAWVYSIAQGGVWLNEMHPFAVTDSNGTTMPSAIELAMYASPLSTAEVGNYIPTRSLDGWKLVKKVAPLPDEDASSATPLNWTQVGDAVELKGWVPYKRIQELQAAQTGVDISTLETSELDFYCAATDAEYFSTQLCNASNAYSETTKDTFTWLKLDSDLFDASLDDTLRAQDAYANGVVYAIALVRNNGVVEDEVLFAYAPRYMREAADLARLQIAIDSENVNRATAGEVRGFLDFMNQYSATPDTMQFVLWQDTSSGTTEEKLTWFVNGEGVNTLPGENRGTRGSFAYSQPKIAYNPILTTTFSLTAQVVGGDALLSLTRSGATTETARALSATYASGTRYSLSLSPWNTEWFSLASVTKNGSPIDASTQVATATVLAVDEASNALTASQANMIESDAELTADTDYALTFTYTPAAALLVASGAIGESQDDDFLAWLLKVDPDAIRTQTISDGVTASEKYWLGLDNAKVSAQDVALSITSIGTHAEPDASTLPALTVALTNEGNVISELKGDGALVLLGKASIDEEWRALRRLYMEDVNGERQLILRTDCKFFKAVLLSARQAATLPPATE